VGNDAKDLTIGYFQVFKGVSFGSGVASYMNVVKGIGITGNTIRVVMTSYNIIVTADNEGLEAVETRDWIDLTAGVTGVVAATFLAGTPVGWGLALGTAVYFGVVTIYDYQQNINATKNKRD